MRFTARGAPRVEFLCGLIHGPTTRPVERDLRMESGAPSFRHRRPRFYREVPGRFSYLLERVHFDLPDTLTRYVEFCGKVFERRWFVCQMSRLENATFTVVQYIDRGD